MKKYNSSLKRNPNAPPSHGELNKLFDFLLKALNFIHANGVIHRDIKPENILVDNDSFALTDFGIASYNPEIFKLRAKTRKGERIGNYLFSAPEQIVGGATAHPSMDIYSLGQICQWYATGSVHRGTKREKLTKYMAEAEAIDIVIEKCLSNRPEDRYQDIQTINVEIQRLQEKDPWHYVRLFEEALAASLPKGLGKVTFTGDKEIINRILMNISLRQFEDNLWWTDGPGYMHTEFSKLTEDIWLMRPYEIKIKSAWVYFDLSMYGDLVLLNLEAMPPFGIYKDSGSYEEVGLVDNEHYISRSEYDNGYAEINGKIIDLSKHKVAIRCRYLIDKSLLIGTRYHSALERKNAKEIELFLNNVNQGKWVSEEQFKHFAMKLRENKHPYIFETL
jgi:serine/threonine-protein kinase